MNNLILISCKVAEHHAANPSRARAAILRLTSEQAAILFVDDSLDFCYIDAQHDFLSVMQDITRWWPKVRSGGIIAGFIFTYSPCAIIDWCIWYIRTRFQPPSLGISRSIGCSTLRPGDGCATLRHGRRRLGVLVHIQALRSHSLFTLDTADFIRTVFFIWYISLIILNHLLLPVALSSAHNTL